MLINFGHLLYLQNWGAQRNCVPTFPFQPISARASPVRTSVRRASAVPALKVRQHTDADPSFSMFARSTFQPAAPVSTVAPRGDSRPRLVASRGSKKTAPPDGTTARARHGAANAAGESADVVDVEAVRIALGLLDKRIEMAVAGEDFAAAAKLRDERTESLQSLTPQVQILVTRLDRLCRPGGAASVSVAEDRAVAANALMEARDTRALPSLAAALRASPGHVGDGSRQHSLVEMTMWWGCLLVLPCCFPND